LLLFEGFWVFLRKSIIGIIASIAICASVQPARANGGASRATEYLVDRLAFDLALNESKEITIKELGELLKNARSRMYRLPSRQLEEVTSRIAKIRERFEETWGKPGRGEKNPELMPAEKAWLDQAISKELRINSSWRIESSEEIEFLRPAQDTGTLRSGRDRFLKETSEPVLTEEASKTPESARPKAVSRFKNGLKKMAACRTHPFNAQRMSDFGTRYALVQLGVDELMTAGTAIGLHLLSSGESNNVDLKMLPQELAFEAMESLRDSFIATSGGTFRVRWFKMQTVGFGTSTMDMMVYQFSSNTGAPGPKKNQDTFNRGAYDTAWNTVSGSISIKLFDLIAGLECTQANSALVFGIQAASGIGVNVAYFGLRAATNSGND
jgi:hypothetical protein